MITVYDGKVALEYARSNQMWVFTFLTQPKLANSNSNPNGCLVHIFVKGNTRRRLRNIPNLKPSEINTLRVKSLVSLTLMLW